MIDIPRDRVSLIKDSSMLVVAGLVTGSLYSLVHLLLLREMNPISYAMFASLMALLKIMSVPSMALLTSIARYTSQFVYENATAVWVTIVKRAAKKMIVLGLVALAIWSLLAGVIKDILNVPSKLNIIMLGVIAFLGLFAPVVQGTLQGARCFGWLAVSGVGNALARVAFCLLALFIFGSQVSPVLAAVAGGAIVGLFIGLWPFRSVMLSVKEIEGYDTKPVYSYLWPVLIGQGALFFITELDLVLAPRYLNGEHLAAYTAAAMLTRTIFMLTQPFATALFPRAVVAKKKWMTIGTLALSLAVSSVVACLVYFFAEIPLAILRKNTPVHVEILKLYVWAALPLSMISIMAPYLWARNRLRTVMCLVPVAVLYGLLRYRFSSSPEEMIACLAGILWLATIVLGVSMIKELLYNDDRKEIDD